MRTAVLLGFKGSEMLQQRKKISITLLYHNLLKLVIAGEKNGCLLCDRRDTVMLLRSTEKTKKPASLEGGVHLQTSLAKIGGVRMKK